MYLQLEKGVDGLFDSFARLDSRISSVGQTAAKIGDHLQVRCCCMRKYFHSFLIQLVIDKYIMNCISGTTC